GWTGDRMGISSAPGIGSACSRRPRATRISPACPVWPRSTTALRAPRPAPAPISTRIAPSATGRRASAPRSTRGTRPPPTRGAGAEVAPEAEATPGAATVRAVECLRGGVRLGEAAAPPFRLVWRGAGPGSYAFTARARDDRGASAISAPVLITVVEPTREDRE